jgi:predicted dehydrogenase/nucleoside-diphosphate-sugar epimerase
MHAAALARVADAELVAVCDTDTARARHLAEQLRLPNAFGSTDEAVASGAFDTAHVLVPPDRHLAVARELLDAGVDVLVEKPMGLVKTECENLATAAEKRGRKLGVNHTSVFYPAYLKLRRAVMSRSFGALQHVIVIVNHPLSWLTAFPGQWKLQYPKNLVYETVVHPFAQVYDLAGSAAHAETISSGRHDLGSGRHFFDTWQVSLVCERATAHVFLSHGSYQIYQVLAICEDGLLSAEVEKNRFTAFDRSRWPPYSESLHLAGQVALQEFRNGLGNSIRAVDAALHPSPMDAVDLLSMTGSIESFHRGSSRSLPNVDGRFGARVVGMCEAAARRIAGADTRARPSVRRRQTDRCDVAVVGAMDLVGASLIEQIAAAGGTVRVMPSDVIRLVPRLGGPELNIADNEDVATAVKGARAVVQLASRWRLDVDPPDSFVVELIPQLVKACSQGGVERLVYVGSISSLDLANPEMTITGGAAHIESARHGNGSPRSGQDPREAVLVREAAEASLPLCIMRTGIVFGRGGSPYHRGVGTWHSETHCIGWNDGTNPLPLVLASDVATAIRHACDSELSAGRSYNLVGDVRLSAREYVAELREALERPVVFHPRRSAQHQAVRVSKWLLKSLLSRSSAPFPSYRSLQSMGCLSAFDCSDVKADLGWIPVAERGRFVGEGVRVYRERFWT